MQRVILLCVLMTACGATKPRLWQPQRVPLGVYVEPGTPFQAALTEAMRRWEVAVGCALFEYVESYQADVVVRYQEDASMCLKNTTWVAYVQHFELLGDLYAQDLVICKKGKPDYDWVAILMHELGHVLGFDHEGHITSVMHTFVVHQSRILAVKIPDYDIDIVREAYCPK